jgi:hypothetical protein
MRRRGAGVGDGIGAPGFIVDVHRARCGQKTHGFCAGDRAFTFSHRWLSVGVRRMGREIR